VIVLGGDGGTLMNLGSLITITACAPGNLIWSYSLNGGPVTPGSYFYGVNPVSGLPNPVLTYVLPETVPRHEVIVWQGDGNVTPKNTRPLCNVCPTMS
jgi:hypothetical protein